MTTYQLRCAYDLSGDRVRSVFERQNIAADSLTDACALARTLCIDHPGMRLVSAVMTGPDQRVAWSLQPALPPGEAAAYGIPLPATAGL